jgi:hypothetical protein
MDNAVKLTSAQMAALLYFEAISRPTKEERTEAKKKVSNFPNEGVIDRLLGMKLLEGYSEDRPYGPVHGLRRITPAGKAIAERELARRSAVLVARTLLGDLEVAWHVVKGPDVDTSEHTIRVLRGGKDAHKPWTSNKADDALAAYMRIVAAHVPLAGRR